MSSSRNSASKSSANPRVAAATTVLKGVLDSMRSWTDADIDALIAGELELSIRLTPRNSRSKGHTGPMLTRRRVDEIRSALGAMDTREEGFRYLEELELSRDALRRLALAIDLPTSRADNMERMRNRIVEGLIGYRLRSKAIRGQGQLLREDTEPTKT